MLRIPPSVHIHKRRGRKTRSAPPAPPALALVSASYDHDEQTLTLQFDRAVDVAGFDGTQVTVVDGEFNTQTFDGEAGATLLDPTTVRVALAVTGSYEGAGVKMTATGASGIVAMDDGGTWAGATDLELPFP
jgi:hypothetical protein